MHLLISDVYGDPTEDCSIEDELVATTLVGFKDLDMNDTEDEI